MARGILWFLCFNTLWLTVWCALVQSKVKIVPGYFVKQPDSPVSQPDGPMSQPDGPVSQPDGRVSQPDGPVSQPDVSVRQPAFSESRQVIRESQVNVSERQPDVPESQSDVSVRRAVLNKFDGLDTKIMNDSAVDEEEMMRKNEDLMGKLDLIETKRDEILDIESKRENIYSCESLRHNGGGTGGPRRQVVTWHDGTRVLCDTYTSGGGWTIFQRRFNGKENFDRGWNDYVNGFGTVSPDGEFWMGLEKLQKMLATGTYELRVDFKFKSKYYYATYSKIRLGPASSRYRLAVICYSGNTGDSLSSQDGAMFATKDRDSPHRGTACAKGFNGGWWYHICYGSNLNGLWASNEYGKGMIWFKITGYGASVNFSEMKVRRRK